MKLIKQIFLLILANFLVACGTSDVKTLDDISESFILGVEDLGQHRMNPFKLVYGGDGKIDRDATLAIGNGNYDLERLTVVNTEQEFDDIKYFLIPEDIQKLEAIDLSQKTLLFASHLHQSSSNLSHITIKKIEHDEKNHIHCVVYKDNRSSGDLATMDFIGMYHAYTIPKIKTEYIRYEVFNLQK